LTPASTYAVARPSRIEWSSVADHEQGFRRSPGFGPFFAAVKPFFEQIEEMRHYDPIAARSVASSAR
jgi:hypothetical protein